MKRKITLFFVFLSVIGLILWFAQPLFGPLKKPLTAFNLIDHHNRPFTLAQLKGRWSFLFFGYTYCPDICPVTLSLLRAVKTALAPRYNDIQYLFISVDSQRDTPEKLSQYVQFFDPDFIGLTGTQADIDQVVRQLGIIYIRKPGSTATDYLIDHSSAILLINPQAEWVGELSAPHTVADITARYIEIRQTIEAQSP